MNSRKIKTAAHRALPGEKAHRLMMPQPKIIEGVEGIHGEPPVSSAVMVLILPYENSLAIPFIKRTDRGKYHRGQIAFPGGKVEKEDADALQAALRECQEEIGIPPAKISILSVLSDIYIPLSNYNITPIVGTALQLPDFTLSTDEVEDILLIKLSDLFDDRNKTTRSFSRHEHPITAPGYQIGDHFIWGATAMIIAELEQLMKMNTSGQM